MEARHEADAIETHMRLHGEITCALARDNPSRLARLLAQGRSEGTAHNSGAFDDNIHLAETMAFLASNAEPRMVGVVAPLKRKSCAPPHPLRAVGLCRSADSAALPEGPQSLVELAVFYGARRCLAFLVAHTHVDMTRCETALIAFLETRAWRHGVVCWGPCVLLRNRHRPDIVRPMVAAVGPCCGARLRFFDPTPIMRVFVPVVSAEPDRRRMCDRLVAAVRDAAQAAIVSLCASGESHAPLLCDPEPIARLFDSATVTTTPRHN